MSEHSLELTSSFLGDTWRAVCSCGWMGTPRKEITEASRDCHDHRRAMADPPKDTAA